MMSFASNHLAWQQRVKKEQVDARRFFTSNINFFSPSNKDSAYFSSTRLMSPEANHFGSVSQRGGSDGVDMRSFHKE
jgi:hypothetical protein